MDGLGEVGWVEIVTQQRIAKERRGHGVVGPHLTQKNPARRLQVLSQSYITCKYMVECKIIIVSGLLNRHAKNISIVSSPY